MNYQLIALDMDGTLLNSQSNITKECLESIEKASQQGYVVIISTGRSLSELKPYLDILKGIRYLIIESGAIVYDLKERKILFQKTFLNSDIQMILAAYHQQDIMAHIFVNGYSYSLKSQMHQMHKYQMEKYQDMFQENVQPFDDIDAFINRYHQHIEKINFYHQSPKEREQSLNYLTTLNVPKVCVEQSSLEMTPLGVDKGTGLIDLCQHLEISIDQTIAVGDSHNDLEILKTAGLAIAMGNAHDEIKEVADVIVSDCDHHGVAEAIERYLLSLSNI